MGYWTKALPSYPHAMKLKAGFTLIELILALALMGILLAVGVSRLNLSGSATRQAAEVVSAAVNRARYEAIRTNNTAGLTITAGTGGSSGSIVICRDVDETVALACSTGAVAETIDFDGGDLTRAVITSPASVTFFFDRRGILRNPSSTSQVITIADRSGNNIRTVSISATGRAEVVE